MKLLTLVITIWMFASTAHAQAKKPADAAPAFASKKACLAKMEKLVRDTAKSMGLKMAFGMQFINANADKKDTQDKPLLEFSTGVFIVEEGYLSNSGATVLVRETAKDCEILKLSVSIGG